MLNRRSSLALSGLFLVGVAFAAQGCVAIPGEDPQPNQIDPGSVSGTSSVDLTSYKIAYYPKDGNLDLGYCTAPGAVPAGTSFKLKTALLFNGDPSSVYTPQEDLTDQLNLNLTETSSGGLTPAFQVPVSQIQGANLSQVVLELQFWVTLPASEDPTQTRISDAYTIWLSPVVTGGKITSFVQMPSSPPYALTPHPGDCKNDFPATGPITQEYLISGAGGMLTTSNASCNGVPVAQAWPTGATIQIDGPGIITTSSGQISLTEISAASPLAVSKDGSYYLSVKLSSPSEIPDPTLVTGLTFSAEIKGVPALAGKIFPIDAGKPTLNIYYPYLSGTQMLDKSQVIAEISFGAPVKLPVADPAELCPGSPCMDGSEVINCPLYNCVAPQGQSGSSGGQQLPPPSPIGYQIQCASTCQSLVSPGVYTAPLCNPNSNGDGN